jgi:hypothetical protein
MSKYEYTDRPRGGGWLMEVRKGASHKGNIRKNPITGRYQFYRGSVNATRCAFEESDVETLKSRIEELDLK